MTGFSQGDVVVFDHNPARGHEPQGRRPSVVLSNDDFNLRTSLGIVAPVSRTDNGFPLHLPLPEDCLIQGFVCIEQLRAVDLTAREARVVDTLDDETIDEMTRIARLCV